MNRLATVVVTGLWMIGALYVFGHLWLRDRATKELATKITENLRILQITRVKIVTSLNDAYSGPQEDKND